MTLSYANIFSSQRSFFHTHSSDVIPISSRSQSQRDCYSLVMKGRAYFCWMLGAARCMLGFCSPTWCLPEAINASRRQSPQLKRADLPPRNATKKSSEFNPDRNENKFNGKNVNLSPIAMQNKSKFDSAPECLRWGALLMWRIIALLIPRFEWWWYSNPSRNQS